MDFNLTEEQLMLRDAAGRYVREQYGFEARRHTALASGWSPDQWSRFAEMGWLGLSMPEALGGLGCGIVETAVVAEELGRGLVLEPFIGCAVLAARLLETADNPAFTAQREPLCEALVGGSLQLALAYCEPGSRFALEPTQTVARTEGDGHVIDGLKMMVPGAGAADQFIVSARLPDQDLALFLVPRADVVVREYPLIDGTRAGDVQLVGVRVAAHARLTLPATARAALEEALDRAALAQVAEALGCMEAVLDITSDYLKTRHQYGQPIGKFQALQHRMAEMFVEVQEARSILYRGIAHLEAAPHERQLAVSAAKVVLGSAGRFVGGQGIQLHGGIGVTDEYQISHLYKRLLVLEKMYGDSDWHLNRFIKSHKEAA